MTLSGLHWVTDLKELWAFRSFRARIFLAVLPTTISLIIGHFAADRTRPYEFISEGSYIEPPAGRGGDQVTVNWHVKHNRTCNGNVERQLVDPVTDVILATYDPAPAAQNGVSVGSDYLRKVMLLPRGIQKGTIAYQAKLTYYCNWLQNLWPALAIRYTTPKLLFKIED